MTKASRWAWVISLVVVTGAALVLSFLLAMATNNRSFYEEHYTWLFWLNLTVAALLMLVIGTAAVRMVLRVQRGKFGSRLLLKLAAIFALVGVLPGVLIYTVSYQFVSRGIESWFDVRVEGALDAGLALGRGTLDAQINEVSQQTLLAAERLGDMGGDAQPLALERLREQMAASDLAIVGASGQVLLSVSRTTELSKPERPPLSLLSSARSARVAAQLEGLDDDGSGAPVAGSPPARIRALAIVPSSSV